MEKNPKIISHGRNFSRHPKLVIEAGYGKGVPDGIDGTLKQQQIEAN